MHSQRIEEDPLGLVGWDPRLKAERERERERESREQGVRLMRVAEPRQSISR